MTFPLSLSLPKLMADFASLNFRRRGVQLHVGEIFPSSRPRALLYYKMLGSAFGRSRQSFRHSNLHEIGLMVEVLKRYGFSVDIIDRTASWAEISKLSGVKYDLYLANAAGNSAPFHERILKEFQLGVKVVYAAGPEPGLSCRLVQERHDLFHARTGVVPRLRRLVKGDGFERRFDGVDAIFCIGESFCMESYKPLGCQVYPILPSSAPLSMSPFDVNSKDKTKFLFMGGTGCICKGLDLVLEAFDGLKKLSLDVFSPTDETDFWQYYQPLLKRNPQIRVHGFVNVMSPKFTEVTKSVAFNVFPSSSEGCATSVTTCMRRGVIPMCNWESGVSLGSFGIALPGVTVEAIRKSVLAASVMSQEEVLRRSIETYAESFRYSDTGFQRGFERALMYVLRGVQHAR